MCPRGPPHAINTKMKLFQPLHVYMVCHGNVGVSISARVYEIPSCWLTNIYGPFHLCRKISMAVCCAVIAAEKPEDIMMVIKSVFGDGFNIYTESVKYGFKLWPIYLI